MLIVAPDFARRIDLPGIGPCPRPIDLDQFNSGLTALVSLRVYAFAGGMTIDGEAEEDEVFVALMHGRAAVDVDGDGRRVLTATLDEEGGPRALYLPPHAAYRLTAGSDCAIAYARARPGAARFPAAAAFAPTGARLAVSDHAAGMTLTLASLPAGAALSLAGPGGALAERFIHLRGGGARVGPQALADWDAAALAAGEASALQVGTETTDVLLIAARTT